MMTAAARRFAALPTPAKLLLILSAALLPIGLGLVWVAHEKIDEANAALKDRADEQARIAVRDVALEAVQGFDGLLIKDGQRQIEIKTPTLPAARNQRPSLTVWPIGNGRLSIEVEERVPMITTVDRLVLLLPVLMWVIAALM